MGLSVRIVVVPELLLEDHGAEAVTSAVVNCNKQSRSGLNF
jgi:hypothetical protein